MILNALLYFANKGSLKTFFSSCKSHIQCKTPEATERKKMCLEIMLSVYARTSQAKILHLDQKAALCTTCERLCGKFEHFIHL